MVRKHSVKAYDEELRRLVEILCEMMEIAEAQCRCSIDAIVNRDTSLAAQVRAKDTDANRCRDEAEELVMHILALRQPVASDLRTIIASLRMAVDLERLADYAANIAKKVRHLELGLPDEFFVDIKAMGDVVQSMIREARTALEGNDAEGALGVWHRDNEVDDIYIRLMAELRSRITKDCDAANVTAYTHMLFVAKGLERMGDHLTNIAEQIYFLVKGVPLHDPET